ncbi:MAG: DNA mismatch repair protein MutS [Methanoregulaceae archaeon PtaU1.Bin059]|nr:MAG: DNA mismatch repair protein MutS [Methanoregulaceae archaeon PtaU1.Bin059]
MKPHLLFRNRDFCPAWGMLPKYPQPTRWRDREYEEQWALLPHVLRMVTQDLELDILFKSMAQGDRYLYEVAKNVVLLSVPDTGTILYRQDILRDCIRNTKVVREIYGICDESIEGYFKEFTWYTGKSADSVRGTSIRALTLFIGKLVLLRKVAEDHGGTFESEGFREFFAMLKRELTDEYIVSLNAILGELSLPAGACITAELGKGNKGTNYTLQRCREIPPQTWIARVLSIDPSAQYSFTIADRDTTGFRALAEMRGKSLNPVSRILHQATDHIFRFFTSLKIELAFYLGCVHLREELMRLGEPVCFPVPREPGNRTLTSKGLYDACMALQKNQAIIGNDVNAEGKDLVLITGANRGGKSTFLRSVGLAQLLMQCGSCVPAESFSADVCRGVFTHFRREEDHEMRSGKLDEELTRMSEIIDHLSPDSMVLFNESFAATNEREGSEISRQIVCALLKKRVKIIFVTHLHEFSRGLFERNMGNASFLRAERKPDGERTFKIKEGEPLQTSFGKDLYHRIFCES